MQVGFPPASWSHRSTVACQAVGCHQTMGSARVVRTSAKADWQCVVRGDGPGHGKVVLLLLAFEQAPEISATEHAKREESGITLSHVLDVSIHGWV